MKHWKQRILFSFVCGVQITCYATAEDLLLEPNIQGYSGLNLVHTVNQNGDYYFNIQDMADALRFKFNAKTNKGNFLGQDFNINRINLMPSDLITYDGQKYYSKNVYQQLFPIDMSVNPLEMQLIIGSEEMLPTTRLQKSAIARENSLRGTTSDSFANYDFDNRLFTFPVLDIIYRHDENFFHNSFGENKKLRGDFYQLNAGMIFAGLDSQITLFGDNYGNSNFGDMRARATVGRTFLDEPRNIFNLVKFEAGDILGVGNSLFNYGQSGRGIILSSFKDLVISADKTIDITGPMSNGWEAELYLNNQLIGFRQSSINGRYEFNNIPVNYGLNNFKVVLYGPFGEVREIDRRYYSGTSPVKAKEFGYNINVYQANRYLFESHEPFVADSDVITADTMFYYGLSDRLTLLGGVTNAENPTAINDSVQFGTLGLQMALNGVSVQYNTNYNLKNQKFGHHLDLQGNIYIGDMFARYEYYGDTQSPISYYAGSYLKDLFEGRLTGWIPWINVPYYTSYTSRTNHNNERFQEVVLRLSPNFQRFYNISVENVWKKDANRTTSYIEGIMQASYGKFRMNARAAYQTLPDDYLRNYGALVEYRWDKNTYFQTMWNHDCRSNYVPNSGDVDAFTVGLGRLFKIGGITFTTTLDTDKNIAFGIAYNTSIGKLPDSYDLFMNSETQMTDYGAVFARVRDESGNPVSNIGLIVSGRETESVTDKNGNVLITDIEPYQKAILTVNEESIENLSLTPEFTTKKLVLRPAAVRTIDIPFNHLGGIEGQVSGMVADKIYMLSIINSDGNVVMTKTLDLDGSFIFDELPYGNYVLVISDSDDNIVRRTEIKIDKNFYSIANVIDISPRNKK